MLFAAPIASAENAPTTLPTPENDAPITESSDAIDIIPDAMQHAVKAPDIDFATLRDPFASYLALVAQRGRAMLDDQRLRLENREREELENFDLSVLKLVGIYTMGEDRIALIEDKTGKGYSIRRGNHMGKNNGRVEKIDNDTLYLVEQVINPAGDVVDNQVTMTLKEVND